MQLWSKHNCWISNGKTIIFAYFLLLLRLLSLQTYCIFFCLKFALSPAKLLLLFCYAFSLNFTFFCKKNALSLADRLLNVCKTHILATFGLDGKFTKSIVPIGPHKKNTLVKGRSHLQCTGSRKSFWDWFCCWFYMCNAIPSCPPCWKTFINCL